LCHFFLQIGESGRSSKELERTIALLKKVVEKIQAENEQLKKAPGVISAEQLKVLQLENKGLKVRNSRTDISQYIRIYLMSVVLKEALFCRSIL